MRELVIHAEVLAMHDGAMRDLFGAVVASGVVRVLFSHENSER
jgi:hypothetical protein